MNEPNPQLMKDLEDVLVTGTAAEAKEFVMTHFKEFPEEAQQKFAVGLFADALDEDLAGREALVELKKEAVETIDAFEESEKQD